jgi:hypothetical protein
MLGSGRRAGCWELTAMLVKEIADSSAVLTLLAFLAQKYKY